MRAPKSRIIVQFPTALLAHLDVEARRLGVSRSELVRDAIACYFQRLERRELNKLLAEGYMAAERAANPSEGCGLEGKHGVGMRCPVHGIGCHLRGVGGEE